jgi:hypothetical protein
MNERGAVSAFIFASRACAATMLASSRAEVDIGAGAAAAKGIDPNAAASPSNDVGELAASPPNGAASRRRLSW